MEKDSICSLGLLASGTDLKSRKGLYLGSSLLYLMYIIAFVGLAYVERGYMVLRFIIEYS
jgi:hypothetical protein